MDKEARREYFRTWARNNPEKRKRYTAKWRSNNVVAIRARAKASRLRNRDQRIAQGAEYRNKHRDRIRAYSKAYYQANKEKHRQGRMKSHLKKKYQLTEAEYAAMFLNQNGKCAVCGNGTGDGRRLHVDHDHDNKKVRALLCYGCNSGLGSFKDDPDRVEKAAKYLRHWQEQHSQ